MNPLQLAKQQQAQVRNSGLQRRVQRQLEDDAAELPTFWQGYDPGEGQHIVQRLGGEPVAAGTSITSGGFAPGQAVDTAYSQGLAAVDGMPFQKPTREQATTTLVEPNVWILVQKKTPLSLGVPQGEVFTFYVRHNQRGLTAVATLTSQFQEYETDGGEVLSYPSEFSLSSARLCNVVNANRNVLLIQILESWGTRATILDGFTLHGQIHTYVVNRSNVAEYHSELVQLSELSTEVVPIEYPLELNAYLRFLAPSVENGTSEIVLTQPPILAQFDDLLTSDSDRFIFQNRKYWAQVKQGSALVESSWYRHATDHNYQLAVRATNDNSLPAFRRLKITAAEFELLGLVPETPIYGYTLGGPIPIGTFGDIYTPSSSANQLPYLLWGPEQHEARLALIRLTPGV